MWLLLLRLSVNFVALEGWKARSSTSQYEKTLATMPAIALINGYYKTKLTKYFKSGQDGMFKGYGLKSINWKQYA